MASLDLTKSSNTSLTGTIKDFSISSARIDESTQDETYHYNTNFPKYLGYYKQIPELKQAIDSLAMWSFGRGYETDTGTQQILEHLTGWGEDTIDALLMSMLIMKKVNGDAYAEIIEEENTLINLKPLNPENVRHVVGRNGILKRYDVWDGQNWKPMATNKIFHVSNNRIANEIHGTSVIESCKWVIDAKQEAMSDWRRILHRSTIRVIEIDSEDVTTLNAVKTQYADAVKNGEVLILPKANTELKDYTAPAVETFLAWIRYLENFFYQAVGVPKAILGGTQEFSEASSKVSYMTFDQIWSTEQRLMEQDIWNQLYLRISFNKPVSLKDEMTDSEAKNTGQVGFQPNEMMAQVGRVE